MPESLADHRRYLDPRTLAKISSLELRARLIVEGLVTGSHRSPYQGISVEFAQHRPYTPGDDIRHVDWKVLAKSDKVYLKQYQEETNLQLILAVDASESMGFGSIDVGGAKWTKYDHAISLAASLGYLAVHQADSVGLAIFDQQNGAIERAGRQVKPVEHALAQRRLCRRELQSAIAVMREAEIHEAAAQHAVAVEEVEGTGQIGQRRRCLHAGSPIARSARAVSSAERW